MLCSWTAGSLISDFVNNITVTYLLHLNGPFDLQSTFITVVFVVCPTIKHTASSLCRGLLLIPWFVDFLPQNCSLPVKYDSRNRVVLLIVGAVLLCGFFFRFFFCPTKLVHRTAGIIIQDLDFFFWGGGKNPPSAYLILSYHETVLKIFRIFWDKVLKLNLISLFSCCEN